MIMKYIWCLILVNNVHLQFTPRQPHQSINSRDDTFQRRNNDGVTPLNLVLLPPRFRTQRCLDGSPFGYFIRRSNSDSNSRKWILFLMGGGACVTPMDCIKRKTNPRGWGSSTFWNSTFLPGTDFPGFNAMHDILSDNPRDNPTFFDYNHVYLQYCSGDLWTGTRKSFDRNGLWFSGHNNIEAAIMHLNQTENFGFASHLFVLGVSAGGWGLLSNIDFIREKWVSKSTIVKAAPIDGFIPPGPVTIYELYNIGFRLPLNGVFTKYLTSWYRSALDESCVRSTWAWRRHRCLDASHVYQFVDSSLFIIQNRFDSLIMQQFLRAPLNTTSNSFTRNFVKWYGSLTTKSLSSKVQSGKGKYKGDGLFLASCLKHASNFCLSSGPVVNGFSLRDVLSKWFQETNPRLASKYQEIDQCNRIRRTSLPCNSNCQCLV